MRVYFELIGLMYARGGDAEVLSGIKTEIVALLQGEGFELSSYHEADVKLYVNPDHEEAMYGLEKESGDVVGISCNSRRSDSGRTIFVARNGKKYPYFSCGGGNNGTRGKWYGPVIVSGFKDALEALSKAYKQE